MTTIGYHSSRPCNVDSDSDTDGVRNSKSEEPNYLHPPFYRLEISCAAFTRSSGGTSQTVILGLLLCQGLHRIADHL